MAFFCLFWVTAKKIDVTRPELAKQVNGPVSIFIFISSFFPCALLRKTFANASFAASLSSDLFYLITIFIILNILYCVFHYYSLTLFLLFHKKSLVLIKTSLLLLPIAEPILPFLFFKACFSALNIPMPLDSSQYIEKTILFCVGWSLPWLLYFSFSKSVRDTQKLINKRESTKEP